MSNFLIFFQATSLIIYITLILSKTIYLYSKGYKPLSIYPKKKGLLFFIIEFSFPLLITLWFGEIYLHLSHSELPFIPVFLYKHFADFRIFQLIGIVIIINSLIFFVLAYITINYSWRIGVDVNSPGPLITHGIYSISRNPIYLSFILYSLGIFLINMCWILLGYFILITLNIHIQIILEEITIKKIYDKDYLLYCSKTKRYFSWRLN